MKSLFLLRKFSLALILALLVGPLPAAADPPGITVARATGSPRTLSPDEMAQLPATQVSVAFGTEHGPHEATFEGPLLWTVLDHEGVIDTAKPRDQVRQDVLVQGHDGYTASLALGEISPSFEGKQVILADKQDGKPLEPGHFRLIVPGDHMGGRSVRDVERVTVVSPAAQ